MTLAVSTVNGNNIVVTNSTVLDNEGKATKTVVRNIFSKPEYKWNQGDYAEFGRLAQAVEVYVDDTPKQPQKTTSFWGRAWNGIKNFFGFGSTSNQSNVTQNNQTYVSANQPQKKGFWGRAWDSIKGFFGFSNNNGYKPIPVYSDGNYPVQQQQQGSWWSRLCNRMNNFYNATMEFSKQPFTKIKHWIMGTPAQNEKITFTGASTESIGNGILKIAAYPLVAPIAIAGAAVDAFNPMWGYIKQETAN